MQASSIDFCEPNFETFQIIAEPMNTLSSFIISYFALLGFLKSTVFQKRVLFSCVFFVGVGSALLHSQLTRVGQLADELPMLVANGCFATMKFDASPIVLIVFPILNYLFFGNSSYKPFLVSFLFQSIFNIFHILKEKEKMSKQKRNALLMVFVAFFLWNLDHLCLPRLKFLFLHSQWHCLIGYACYSIISSTKFHRNDRLLPSPNKVSSLQQ